MNNIINIDKLKEQLAYEGIKFDAEFNSYYLENKHISRHMKNARFMKANDLPMLSSVLTALYRADVVCRQEMLVVLMPIEMSITTKVLYLLQHMNIDINDFWSSDLWFNIDAEENKRKRRMNNNKEFINDAIIKILKKWNTTDVVKLIEKFTFGQTAALIKLLKPESQKFILNISHPDEVQAIDDLVNIRNYIAHLEQLFINDNIEITPHHNIPLNKIIEKISKLANGDFNKDFATSLDRYINNVTRKIPEEDQNHKENIEKMFSAIKTKLFSV